MRLIATADAPEREADAVDLEQLAVAAIAGDEPALQALIRDLYSPIVSLAWRLVGDAADAQDIAQETCVVVARRLGSLREPEKVLGWTRSITVNLCKKRFRSRARYRARFKDVDADAIDQHFATDGDPEQRTAVSRLYAALSELRRSEQLAVLLKEVEGYTWDEMAEATGWSVSTLKRRHRTGVARLKDLMGGSDG